MKNKLQAKFFLVNSTIEISKFFYPKSYNFKNSLALFFVVMGMSLSWGQIITFDFAGATGSEATINSTATNSNLGICTITRGPGLISGNNADRYNGVNWAITSIDNAISGNNYMQFTINPNNGFQFSVSSIIIQLQRSATGLTAIVLRSSKDGYISNLDSQKSIVDNTTTQSFTFTFTQSNSLTDVTYRLYGYAESITGTGGPGDGFGNDIIINGSVISSTNNWIGGTGNWSATTNWSLGTVPQSTDNITIATGNPSMDVDYTLSTGRTLTISGTGGLTINSGKTITISGAADFGGKPILIKSDSNGSGAVGPILGTLIGANNVTVERFIPSKRAWRALTSPVIGTTNNSIFYNWQNNGTVNNGLGVELWGTSGTGNTGNGLSLGSSNSILQYNNTGTSGAWNPIINTKTTNLFDGNINNAFMVFVTGPYATTSTNISGGSAETTLKATGQLIVGPKTYANLPSGVHTLIGNPYASSISPLLLLNGNTSFGNNLWIWDAKATNNNSVGAFNSFDRVANRYTNITNTTMTPTTPDIQSGQAFFVKANSGTATLTISEGFKLGTTSANTIFKTGTRPEIVRIGLYKQENNEWSGRDGAMEVVFSESEANQATNKMTNGSENIAFTKNGILFASEHHLPLVHSDILNIKVWNLTVGSNYKLKIHTEDFVATNLQATLEDLYTNTRTPISLDGSAVEYPFTVTTDALSTGDRFRIIFQSSALGTNIPKANGFSIIPNPVISDSFQVNLGSLATGTYSFTICNSIGQEVEKGSFDTISQNTNYTIQINNFVSGIYFMKIKGSDNSVFISKIIKN
jgi:hypothetical protein